MNQFRLLKASINDETYLNLKAGFKIKKFKNEDITNSQEKLLRNLREILFALAKE